MNADVRMEQTSAQIHLVAFVGFEECCLEMLVLPIRVTSMQVSQHRFKYSMNMGTKTDRGDLNLANTSQLHGLKG